MTWPVGCSYQDALQAPEVALAAAGLGDWTVLRDPLGMPRVSSGTFGVVFELAGPHEQRRAIKCFTRAAPDVDHRYAVLAADARARALNYLVDFAYLPAGILVDGRHFPLLSMEWVDGAALIDYLDTQHRNRAAVAALAERFRALVTDLEAAGVAHGDLQHDNIVVRADGSLRVIDYDGMYVPALDGLAASERGVPDYQSPRRGQEFGPYLDRFSAWVIYLSLRALAIEPELWTELRPPGSERLLLRATDYTSWDTSPAVARLRSVPDAQVKQIVARVGRMVSADLAEIPPLAGLTGDRVLRTARPQDAGTAGWIQDHTEAVQGAAP